MSFVPRRSQQAFTLVELLVVIGIIAVLISILLPSLARARQQANMVSCLSNLRQIGQALQLYTNDNKGFLPYGRGPNNLSNGRPYITNWTHELSAILGKDVGTTAGQEGTLLAPVFLCPEATLVSGISNDNYKFHYAVNPRLMPDMADTDASANIACAAPDNSHGAIGRLPVRRQLATVSSGTDKMLMWDGAQVPVDVAPANPAATMTEGNNNASLWSGGLDGGGWSAGTMFTDPAEDSCNLDTKIGIGSGVAYTISTDAGKQANIDANKDDATCVMRFRHLGNSQMGALFCDGHAEQRMINTVLRREVCVNWK